MPIKPILILAYGNPSRGDDALGPLLIDELQKFSDELLSDLECITDFQLQIEHALDLKARQLVLFVDASIALSAPISFSQLNAIDDHIYTTHAMSPAAVMHVYQAIESQSPPACFLLSLQAKEFELGSGLSATAQCSLQQACRFVRQLLTTTTLNAWQGYC